MTRRLKVLGKQSSENKYKFCVSVAPEKETQNRGDKIIKELIRGNFPHGKEI